MAQVYTMNDLFGFTGMTSNRATYLIKKLKIKRVKQRVRGQSVYVLSPEQFRQVMGAAGYKELMDTTDDKLKWFKEV